MRTLSIGGFRPLIKIPAASERDRTQAPVQSQPALPATSQRAIASRISGFNAFALQFGRLQGRTGPRNLDVWKRLRERAERFNSEPVTALNRIDFRARDRHPFENADNARNMRAKGIGRTGRATHAERTKQGTRLRPAALSRQANRPARQRHAAQRNNFLMKFSISGALVESRHIPAR